MRVGIVAKSMTLRLGLRELIGSLADMEVSGDSAEPDGLPEADVLVVTAVEDVLPAGEKALPVLLLTEAMDETDRLTDLPVWGVLPLDASAEEISAALHALGEGLWVGAPSLTGRLLEKHPIARLEKGEPMSAPLTQREMEVLQLAAEGLANKQIARRLEISEHTVKFHLSALYAKLGVTSRTEAVRAGVRQGKVVM